MFNMNRAIMLSTVSITNMMMIICGKTFEMRGKKMPSSNNSNIVCKASPHTVKKIELIESYVKSWAQKLMQNNYCNGIIFIDCMCNSSVYHDENGNEVYGTPIRISRILRDVAGQYPRKKVYIYLNDNSQEKIDELKKHLPGGSSNFRYSITCKDGNALLKDIGSKLSNGARLHFFLLYDPYDASIDWDALAPFFRSWGEVLINHMVNDSIRAIRQVKSPKAVQKYEDTYLSAFEDLLPYGSDKVAYEKRVEQIITSLQSGSGRKYYIASFLFFNSRNSLLYDLVHCTCHEAGFKLYKTTAWKTFGGRSSIKNTHGEENQFVIDFTDQRVKTQSDERCYYVKDIVDYLQAKYVGQHDVPLATIWTDLDAHPVFPSDGYRAEIKSGLKCDYGAKISRSTISFTDRR